MAEAPVYLPMTCPKCQGVIFGVGFEKKGIKLAPVEGEVMIACVQCGMKWSGDLKIAAGIPAVRP